MALLKKPGCIFVFSLFTVLFSCSARIDGVVGSGGAAEISIQTALEPRTYALLSSLMGFMGEETDAQVLDSRSISRSMASASGIRSVSLKNTSPSALEGTISISNVANFLSPGDSFISFKEEAAASNILIVLDRSSAPLLISKFSPEVEDYLSALMAPAVLGETMTRQEYLDLVSSVYSRPLANEIAAARIRAFIDFPRPVIEVVGGTGVGKRAEFSIPLLDILVLEQPLRYEVKW